MMHFVARNSTESAYQAQGYTLRNDPLLIFRQPPTNIISRHSPINSPTSTRHHSFGSAKQMVTPGKSRDQTVEGAVSELVRLVSFEKSDEGFVDEPKVSNDEHCCDLEGCRRVVINVAGQKYETQLKTLNRLPSTLLGNHMKRQQYWDPYRKEYFFDRHRPSFPAVLYYYQSGGRLKRPVEVPVDIFMEELEFYQLGDAVIEAFKTSEGFYINEDKNRDPDPQNNLMGHIWTLFEYPDSSLGAKIVSAMSVFFILTSVVIFCLETEPVFHNTDCKQVNITKENGTEEILLKPYYGHPLFIIETICVAWFVIELFTRAVCCPSIVKFVKSLINWIDLASIAPYFIFLAMFLINDSCQSSNKLLSILRVLRVVRVFKLSRFSTGLQILAKTLRISLKELSMFILFLGIGIVIFAGAIYYAEAQNDTSHFISIPDAFWWAVVSMTTVGYGDVYPTSDLGKVIGSACVLSGLLCIALPVPVIVTNFNNIYRQTTGRGANA